MANQVAFTVYQINNNVLSGAGGNGPIRLSFPSQGVLVRDCTGSPNRSLPTGVNVYSAIQVPNLNTLGADLYYVTETQAQVVTAMNA